MPQTRPTASELAAAKNRHVPDVIAPNLRVLLCGINPSLYSAAVGHHFARPGNRFWKALHGAGLTHRLLRPDEEQELLRAGLGITNVVARATANAAELVEEDYRLGAKRLVSKLQRYRPQWIAFVGLGAYRRVAEDPKARVGEQRADFGGVKTWALPNPSGLNAHYQLDALIRVYAELARAAGYVRHDASTRAPERSEP